MASRDTTQQLDSLTETMLRELACGQYGAVAINSGLCAEWAERAVALVGGSVAWVSNSAHAVVGLDGMMYDAETTDGVADEHELPWVARGGIGIEYVDDEGTTWCPWDRGYIAQ